MGSNKLDTTNKKYMKLRMPCSLLDENNSCRVYEVRPTSCWIYKNYGYKEDCDGKIAEHSYPFLEYAQILPNDSLLSMGSETIEDRTIEVSSANILYNYELSAGDLAKEFFTKQKTIELLNSMYGVMSDIK